MEKNRRILLKAKSRQGQRVRLARRIKEIRQLETGKNKIDCLFSLHQISKHYPKISI